MCLLPTPSPTACLFVTAGCAKPVLFLLTGQFFGQHIAPIKVKFGRDGLNSLLPAKFHLDRLRGVGLRPPKL